MTTKPKSFADIVRAKKAEAAQEAASKTKVASTRPAPLPMQRRVVIVKTREDGTPFQRNARPAFLFKDPKSVVERYVLPEGYFWEGSPEHLARRAELGMKEGAD